MKRVRFLMDFIVVTCGLVPSWQALIYGWPSNKSSENPAV